MPVQVQTPTGQMMQVNVPPGVMPGQQFMERCTSKPSAMDCLRATHHPPMEEAIA